MRPTAAPSLVVNARGLTKSFGSERVLRGVDLAIAAGGLTAITGSSGSGKSTLMAVLGTLTPRDGGSLHVLGVSVPTRPTNRASAAVRAMTAWLPQLPLVLPGRTCLDNALAGIRATRTVVADDIDYTTGLFTTLGVAHLMRRDVSVLSGGELQKIALIRALAPHPLLVLADEPTASLDAASTELVVEALLAAAQLATVLVASHDPHVAAAAGRVTALQDGIITEAGPGRYREFGGQT